MEPEVSSDSDSEFEPGGGRRRRMKKASKMRGTVSEFARATTGRKRGVVSYKESSHSDGSEAGEGVEEGGVEMVMVEEDTRDGVERVVQSRPGDSESLHNHTVSILPLPQQRPGPPST